MEKILTAREIAKKHADTYGGTFSQIYSESSVMEACIEFAKLHVIAALKAADTEAENEFGDKSWDMVDDKEFILKAYPLENIK